MQLYRVVALIAANRTQVAVTGEDNAITLMVALRASGVRASCFPIAPEDSHLYPETRLPPFVPQAAGPKAHPVRKKMQQESRA